MLKRRKGPLVRIQLALALALAMLLVPAAAQGAVLYDSTPSVLGQHPTVQDFEAIHDEDDAEVADDFTVPPGQTWALQRVFVDGRQPQPPGPNTTNIVNVALYSSVGALPAATDFYSMQLTSTAVYPDFDLPLPGVAVLGPGTYWFSAQARMNFDLNGQNIWFWGTTPTQRGNGAAYRNPGGGFEPSCVTFQPMVGCLSGVTNPDVAFRLEGTCVGCPTTAPAPPAKKKCKKKKKKKASAAAKKCKKKKKKK